MYYNGNYYRSLTVKFTVDVFASEIHNKDDLEKNSESVICFLWNENLRLESTFEMIIFFFLLSPYAPKIFLYDLCSHINGKGIRFLVPVFTLTISMY